MKIIPVHGINYYLPINVQDLTALIIQAKATGQKICIRGSGHSFPLIPNLEMLGNCIYVLMFNFDAVCFGEDESLMQVTVGGGCHLGGDPFDPRGPFDEKDSLFYKLFKKGCAIPEMGGISHQTVGGFLSTGSSGGSLTYSFSESLLEITILTAEAVPSLKTFRKSEPNEVDDFNAAGVALGMFGFIVSAKFQCVKTFNILGFEKTTFENDCDITLFEDGPNSVANTFKDKEYIRFLWWPQKAVKKIILWQAKQITATDDFVPDPYNEDTTILGLKVPVEQIEHLLFKEINHWPEWLGNPLHEHKLVTKFVNKISHAFYPTIFPKLLEAFVKAGTVKTFQDYWYSGLCMDNNISDKHIPVKFTELWIPITRAKEVMLTLKEFYEADDDNAGSFCMEIYGGKASNFWMSPAYGADVIRIDVFWFADSNKNPIDFFQRYWERFASYNFRCHWGKYLPTHIAGKPGAEYLKAQYPENWDNWMAKRATYDPNKIFVTPYWQQQLGI